LHNGTVSWSSRFNTKLKYSLFLGTSHSFCDRCPNCKTQIKLIKHHILVSCNLTTINQLHSSSWSLFIFKNKSNVSSDILWYLEAAENSHLAKRCGLLWKRCFHKERVTHYFYKKNSFLRWDMIFFSSVLGG